MVVIAERCDGRQAGQTLEQSVQSSPRPVQVEQSMARHGLLRTQDYSGPRTPCLLGRRVVKVGVRAQSQRTAVPTTWVVGLVTG